MIVSIYIVTHTSVDRDMCEAKIIGVCNILEVAAGMMQKCIYNQFESNKKWWEDEEDEDAINGLYQEWIDENYVDDEHLIWSYTDECDECEYHLQIHTAFFEFEPELHDAYVILHTCIDGIKNETNLLGVYASQKKAEEALKSFDLVDNCEDSFVENIISIEKCTIEV